MNCLICKKPDVMHHEFTPSLPKGCMGCTDWASDIPEVCGEFEQSKYEESCVNCEHDERCHQQEPS